MHLIQSIVIPLLMNALQFAHGFSLVVMNELKYDTKELGEFPFAKVKEMNLPFFIDK